MDATTNSRFSDSSSPPRMGSIARPRPNRRFCRRIRREHGTHSFGLASMTNDTLAPACRPARRGDAAQPPRLGAGGPAGWRDFAAARLLHCESRAAGHPRRHRRAPGRAAAGRVRVCVRERRRADHRRPARRPVRPQADVHDRDGRLRRRVDAGSPAAARCWSAAACCRACSPRSSRRRCSRRSAACSPAGAGARDGLLRFRVRPRGRDRSARRRRVDQPASVRSAGARSSSSTCRSASWR